jgi:hypothetical protein
MVFCNLTGETHILNALPAEALRLLGGASYKSEEVADILAARFETERSAAWRETIERVLANLKSIELVQVSP